MGVPDVVICDTPLAIRTARKLYGYKAKVVYDVTEWYPSKKNLRNAPLLLKPFKFCVLVIANLWAGFAADAFLFGERHKAKPFMRLYPWKKSLLLPYYPALRYLHPTSYQPFAGRALRLMYAGALTKEKGWFRVIDMLREVAAAHHGQQFVLTVITANAESIEISMPDNVMIVVKPYMSFDDFCSELPKHDICLDLRVPDIENTRCLPIKLFYYMGSGRAVIYSSLKAIRLAVPELAEQINMRPAERLETFVREPAQIIKEGEHNRQLIQSKYNWESLHEPFIRFIESL